MNIIKRLCFAVWATFVLCIVAACTMRQNQDVPQYDTINVVENFVIDENSVPIFPKKAALTTDTAQRFQ